MPATRPRGRRGTAAPDQTSPTLTPAFAGTLPLGAGIGEDTALARPLALPGVTLEAGVYVVALAVSLLLRFWRLADLPLGPEETRTALASLDIARGGQLPSDAGALLGFGDALVFAIAGATDATARFLPSLVGGLAPLTMVWARPLIGRGSAAIAAALLALSPLLLDGARTVGSGGIAATVSLALAWAIFDYARARRPSRLFAAAILLAGTLTAGIGAVSTIVALAVVGCSRLIELARHRRLPQDLDAALAALAPPNGHAHAPIPKREVLHPPGRLTVLRAAALFAGTLGVIGTGALTNIGGIQAGLFAPIGAWLTGAVAGDAAPAWTAPLILVAYEPFALVMGLAGAALALRRGRALDRFLVWWFGIALVAALLAPDRGAALLSGAVAPAMVLAATVVHRLALVVWPERRGDYLVALLVLAWGGSLVLLGFGHVSQVDPIGVRYVAPIVGLVSGRASADTAATWLLALLPVALLLGGLGYLWQRTASEGQGAIAAAGATLLFAFALHAGWNLTYQVAGNVSELPRSDQTSVDVRALARDVDEVRQVQTINRKDKNLVIDESARYPLAWYLRDRDMRVEARPSGSPAMIILPVDTKPPAGRYVGQRYRAAIEGDLTFHNLGHFWRWLVYRESPEPPRAQDVMLYVRAQ